jgi:hypothetical protein
MGLLGARSTQREQGQRKPLRSLMAVACRKRLSVEKRKIGRIGIPLNERKEREKRDEW